MHYLYFHHKMTSMPMPNPIIKKAWLCLSIAAALAWLGCGKSGGSAPTGPTIPTGPTPPSAPGIASLAPDSGAFNTTVLISGSNFSATASQDIVSFNGVNASVTAATATLLTVTVPKGAGTGNVKVTVGTQTSSGALFTYLYTYTVSTFAGGMPGDKDATGTAAEFNDPFGIAVDTAGNVIVADAGNSKIKMVTPGGVASTIAGGSKPGGGFKDGPAGTALFLVPTGVAVDAQNNILVADPFNYKVREISTATGIVSTVAGSTVGEKDAVDTAAQFDSPSSLALDAAGKIYVTDAHYIRVISGGSVSTLYDGKNYSSIFGSFVAAAAGQNNNLILTDENGYDIYNLTMAGVFSVLAGKSSPQFQDGPVASAYFDGARGIALDAKGNIIVADEINQRIRMITPGGTVSTIAGSGVAGDLDMAGTAAEFNYPLDVAIDKKGNIYVLEPMSNRIRKITIE